MLHVRLCKQNVALSCIHLLRPQVRTITTISFQLKLTELSVPTYMPKNQLIRHQLTVAHTESFSVPTAPGDRRLPQDSSGITNTWGDIVSFYKKSGRKLAPVQPRHVKT